jgi:hypothetical protein
MDAGAQHITAGAISLCIDSCASRHDKQQLFVGHKSCGFIRKVNTVF